MVMAMTMCNFISASPRHLDMKAIAPEGRLTESILLPWRGARDHRPQAGGKAMRFLPAIGLLLAQQHRLLAALMKSPMPGSM